MIPGRVHFIGVGGSGMMPLAILASRKGWQVTGTDRKIDSRKKAFFENLGIPVYTEPDPDNLPAKGTVVYSTAIKPDHPERKAASDRKDDQDFQILHRMEFLNLLFEEIPVRIGVAGTHGKTSTSSMMGWTLLELGLDPDILVGGKPLYLEDGIRVGGGQVAVFETDESDGSFLKSNATHRLILNVDADHLDHYGSLESLKEAFERFASHGSVVVNGDDPTLNRIAEKRQLIRFGTGPSLESTGEFKVESDTLTLSGEGEISLSLPGRHFAHNALGAITLIEEALKKGDLINGGEKPITRGEIARAISSFPGVERRLELLGVRNGVHIFDDYAHHPTEIRAVIGALLGRLPENGKLRVVFQPHRYTRTREHYRSFARELALAHSLFLFPLYTAGESPLEGVSSRLIYDSIENREDVTLMESPDPVAALNGMEPGDFVVFMGAGDISALARGLFP